MFIGDVAYFIRPYPVPWRSSRESIFDSFKIKHVAHDTLLCWPSEAAEIPDIPSKSPAGTFWRIWYDLFRHVQRRGCPHPRFWPILFCDFFGTANQVVRASEVMPMDIV